MYISEIHNLNVHTYLLAKYIEDIFFIGDRFQNKSMNICSIFIIQYIIATGCFTFFGTGSYQIS